jgi:hypothetical protein
MQGVANGPELGQRRRFRGRFLSIQYRWLCHLDIIFYRYKGNLEQSLVDALTWLALPSQSWRLSRKLDAESSFLDK